MLLHEAWNEHQTQNDTVTTVNSITNPFDKRVCEKRVVRDATRDLRKLRKVKLKFKDYLGDQNKRIQCTGHAVRDNERLKFYFKKKKR
jgi:hypothetical protein